MDGPLETFFFGRFRDGKNPALAWLYVCRSTLGEERLSPGLLLRYSDLTTLVFGLFFSLLQQLDNLLGQFLLCSFGMGLTRCADRLRLQIAIIFIGGLIEFI